VLAVLGARRSGEEGEAAGESWRTRYGVDRIFACSRLRSPERLWHEVAPTMPTQSRPFSTPTLVGERFETDSPAIPIDALTELVAYNELIVGLAKELVRTRLGSKRVPKGFTRQFELRLAGIERGSAIARLERVIPSDESGAIFESGMDDFDRGEQVLSEGIEYFNRSGRLPPDFPSNVTPLFRKFGRSLRDGEAFLLRPPTRDRPPVAYTSETRKRLVLLNSDTYSREVDLTGLLVSVDVEVNTFRFRPSDTDYGVIHVPFPGALRTQLTQALADYRFTRIQVGGIANFNSTDAFVDFEGLPSVTLERYEFAVPRPHEGAGLSRVREAGVVSLGGWEA